jgi:hypothetical protein
MSSIGQEPKKELCPGVFLTSLVAVAKQSLGRGLGTLMGRAPKQEDAPVSAGVRSLMRGHNPPVPAPAPVPISPATATSPVAPTPASARASHKTAVPRWYLLAGDVLLVALALTIVYKSPHPLSWQRELFCAALVTLAAVLAVIALLTPNEKPANPPNKP